MAKKSFEELVLNDRARERERYGAALAAERGPLPFSKNVSEADQDAMWQQADPALTDPPEVTQTMQQAIAAFEAQGLKRHQAIQQAVPIVAQAFPQSAFLRLMLPPEAGGAGLTPLAASLRKYKYRQPLYEAAGADLESQITEAKRRAERSQQRQAPAAAPEASSPQEGGY
jgi:hypothetical protein